jgi:hypothetical protein
MSSPKLNDVMNNLLKISQGDVNSLARANAEFAKSITGYTKLPSEQLEIEQFLVEVKEVSTEDLPTSSSDQRQD